MTVDISDNGLRELAQRQAGRSPGVRLAWLVAVRDAATCAARAEVSNSEGRYQHRQVPASPVPVNGVVPSRGDSGQLEARLKKAEVARDLAEAATRNEHNEVLSEIRYREKAEAENRRLREALRYVMDLSQQRGTHATNQHHNALDEIHSTANAALSTGDGECIARNESFRPPTSEGNAATPEKRYAWACRHGVMVGQGCYECQRYGPGAQHVVDAPAPQEKAGHPFVECNHDGVVCPLRPDACHGLGNYSEEFMSFTFCRWPRSEHPAPEGEEEGR